MVGPSSNITDVLIRREETPGMHSLRGRTIWTQQHGDHLQESGEVSKEPKPSVTMIWDFHSSEL